MHNVEKVHRKKIVAAETVGCRLEADLFKSVRIIIGFGYHATHWNVSQQDNGRSRKGCFQIRSRPFQVGTDDRKCLLFWKTLRRFKTRICLLHKPLVSDSKPTSSNQYRSSKAFAVMDNIETFAIRNELLQKPLVSDLRQTSSNEYGWSRL